MNVSIDKLLQPQSSFSRTGKMAEAFTPAKIHVAALKLSKGPLDFSKTLAANEVGSDDANPSCLCSSPRLHPSVLQKEIYVSRTEKEIAFCESMKPVVSVPLTNSTGSVATDLSSFQKSDKARHKSPVVDWAGARALLQEQTRPKPQKPSSSFLAVTRAKMDAAGSSSKSCVPPVGHYRPRYELLEESPPRVKIPKKRAHSPKRHMKHDTTVSSSASAANANHSHLSGAPANHANVDELMGAAMDASVGAGGAVASLPGTIHDGSRPAGSLLNGSTSSPSTLPRAASPSWPFASKSPGHMLPLNKSWSVEPDPSRQVNYTAVWDGRPTSRAFNSMRSLGRQGGSAGCEANLKDVFYRVTPGQFTRHTLTPDLHRTTGRHAQIGLPRTSSDVPRAPDVPSAEQAAQWLEVSRFARQPVLVDIKKSGVKHPSRKPPVPHGAAPESPLDASAGTSRVQSPDLSKQSPRSAGRLAVHDLVYDVRYDAVDGNTKSAFIKEPIVQHLQRNNIQPEAISLLYPDVSPSRPRVSRDISFDGYVSRDGRSRVGRAADAPAVYEAQQKFYDVESVARNAHRGDVTQMSLQVSRDKRAAVSSPDLVTVDTVYHPESADPLLLPSLRRGMVEIQKMVSRDRRSHSSMR